MTIKLYPIVFSCNLITFVTCSLTYLLITVVMCRRWQDIAEGFVPNTSLEKWHYTYKDINMLRKKATYLLHSVSL